MEAVETLKAYVVGSGTYTSGPTALTLQFPKGLAGRQVTAAGCLMDKLTITVWNKNKVTRGIRIDKGGRIRLDPLFCDPDPGLPTPTHDIPLTVLKVEERSYGVAVEIRGDWKQAAPRKPKVYKSPRTKKKVATTSNDSNNFIELLAKVNKEAKRLNANLWIDKEGTLRAKWNVIVRY